MWVNITAVNCIIAISGREYLHSDCDLCRSGLHFPTRRIQTWRPHTETLSPDQGLDVQARCDDSVVKPWKRRHVYFINMHKQLLLIFYENRHFETVFLSQAMDNQLTTFWKNSIHCILLLTINTNILEQTRLEKIVGVIYLAKLSFATHILFKLAYTRNISMYSDLYYCWDATYSMYCAYPLP